MKASICRRRRSVKTKRGFKFLELIIAAILSILTLMALALARVTIQGEKEKELRRAVGDARRESTTINRWASGMHGF
jgi:Tfp pilus assembly protein FimT